jgi:hypothetical protein
VLVELSGLGFEALGAQLTHVGLDVLEPVVAEVFRQIIAVLDADAKARTVLDDGHASLQC